MTDKPLTFLFTDLEDSTRLWDRHAGEMSQASARHDLLLADIITKNGGWLIKKTGDGFHAAFQSPLDGLNAALAGQQALLAEVWPALTGPLRVRMGLHTGASEERDGDYYGVDVNIAARIMGLGHGGQILLSGTTANLLRRFLPEACSLLDLGEQRLKGVAEPEQVFQLSHPALPAEFPQLKSLSTYKHNLRPQRSSFIGREQEVATITALLVDNRLLTLLGPGGTGKTRLMLQVAEEVIEDYQDGVWLVELASLTDPELIPERIAAALNVQEQPGRRLLDTLTEYLRRKHLLLLLDNVEHLVHACAELAVRLLDNCRELSILVTGREALFIDGERAVQIPSLSLPARDGKLTVDDIRSSESVQLFLERARAVRPDLALNRENATAIAEIVLRLDGIPLALELAAARLRMLTVQQVAERLHDRFRLLTGGRRTALPRQQTLQALIDWSWNLLTERERVLLCRLSVFSGGWTLEAAQAVAGFDPLDEHYVFDGLEQLINKSLVIVLQPVGEAARYGMLESIHQYAEARLVEANEAADLRERHLDYFIALVDTYDRDGFGANYYRWRDRLAAEGDNLRSVMDWSAEDRPRTALHLAGTLLQFEMGWMHYREARAWLEAAVARAEDTHKDEWVGGDSRDYARALQALGWLLVTHGEMKAGHELLDRSIRLARQEGEFRILALALGMKAQAMGAAVTWQLVAEVEEAIEFARRSGQQSELVMLLFSAGEALVRLGELDRAEQYLDESARLAGQFEGPSLEAWLHLARAIAAQSRQELGMAERHLLLAAGTNKRLGDRRMGATAHSMLAHIYRRQGRHDEALALYTETIRSWQEQGHQAAVAHQLECFAYLAIERRQYERAARLLGAAQRARQLLQAPSVDPAEIHDLERAMSDLAAAIGADVLDRALASGALMSLDEAVSAALEEE